MAYQNKLISNPVTGQDIRFIATAANSDGKLLEMESTYHKRSTEPTAHYHPYQDETFLVKRGELTILLNGKLMVLKEGESIHIPKTQVHSMWNNTDKPTVVNWQVYPALNTEHLLETITGLAADGKTNHKGMPPLLQLALTAHYFTNVLRLAKPPIMVQKFLFSLLSPWGRLRGYKAVYEKYLD